MRIAQISDCHVTASGALAYGKVDTADFLHRAVDPMCALPTKPDLIVVTGDLTDQGSAEQYAHFASIMAKIDVPFLPVAGNHDQREVMTQAFSLDNQLRLQQGFVQYVADFPLLRIVVIDTTTPGSVEPSLCGDRLEWIRNELGGTAKPILLAMHHPPFPAGVRWMEPTDRDWAAPLAKIVRSADCPIVRVITGHVHRAMTTSWAGLCAMSAPSTAHQIFPDLSANPWPAFSFEAAGFLLHTWDGADMTSYGMAIPQFDSGFQP